MPDFQSIPKQEKAITQVTVLIPGLPPINYLTTKPIAAVNQDLEVKGIASFATCNEKGEADRGIGFINSNSACAIRLGPYDAFQIAEMKSARQAEMHSALIRPR